MYAPSQGAGQGRGRETLDIAVSDPLLGRTLLDAYRIQSRIAEGGMGVVYAGEQLRLNRTVAVKVLRAPLAQNSEALARFRLEAELIARLGHPHIVQIIDVGSTDDGTPFIVMEYLHGETLLDRIGRSGPLSLEASCRVLERLASALSATHRAGVVHRDIKPENVFLVTTPGDAEFVKLLDFGIGKVVAAEHKITEGAVTLGTPEYMAPEQANARATVDARADQYSLAAVAFTMLAGRPPFVGSTPADVLAQLLSDEAPKLSTLRPDLPQHLDPVLAQALEKDPTRRFPSVLDFHRAIERASHGAVPSSRRPARAKSAPPAEPTRGTPPQRRLSTGSRAKAHLEAARQAMTRGAHDDAVEHAEALLELGARDRDPIALDLLRTWLPTLDRIFRERVGSLSQRVAQGARARQGNLENISPKARVLIEGAGKGDPRIRDLIATAGYPEREGLWLIAGLLRRKLLVLL
ncbi:MAG: serine/threonine-protein kinase [Polyangiaceae bacterium]